MAVLKNKKITRTLERIPLEISRKTAHILSGTVAALLPFFVSFEIVMAVAVLFFIAMVFVRWMKLFRSLHSLSRVSYGELLFPIGIFITAFFFHEKTEYVFGVLVLTYADGLAGLIGKLFAKRRIKFFGGHKSYLGSLVFIVVTLLLLLLLTGHMSLPFILIAIELMLVEVVLSSGADNLILAPLAALLLYLYL